jgi:hypothetical protein
VPLTGSAKNLDWSGLNNGSSIYESPLSAYVTVALEYLTATETRSSRRTFLLGSYLFSIFAIQLRFIYHFWAVGATALSRTVTQALDFVPVPSWYQ